MKTDLDLSLCSATLLSDVMRPDPNSIHDQLSAARAAGFTGISLWTMYYAAALQAGHSRGSLLDAIHASGLAIPMIEAILPWDAADEQSAVAEADRTFSLAAELGARQTVVVTMSEKPLDPEFAAARFRAICRVGAAYGVGAMVEFLPWSGIPNLAAAWQIIERADQPNGGIMIDTWHWHRQPGGPNPDLLRRIPGDRIPVVQLCDSAPGNSTGTMHEAMSGRLLPGEGVVDFGELFHVLNEIGASPIIAPEVFNPDLAAHGMKQMAAQVYTASHALLSTLGS